jgi:hypothetical protein
LNRSFRHPGASQSPRGAPNSPANDGRSRLLRPETQATLDGILDRLADHVSDARFSTDRARIKRALVEVQFATEEAMSLILENQQ